MLETTPDHTPLVSAPTLCRRCMLLFVAANTTLMLINLLFVWGVPLPFDVLEHKLSLANEGNTAVWFSSIQLFVTGLVCLVVVHLFIRVRGIRMFSRWVWLGVAGLMFALSLDEVSQWHEWTGTQLAKTLQSNGDDEFLGLHDVYLWLLALLPVIAAAVIMLVTAAIQAARTSKLAGFFMATGIVCWLVVLAAERFEAGLTPADERGFQLLVEEGSELIGSLLFLLAMLRLLVILEAEYRSRTESSATDRLGS